MTVATVFVPEAALALTNGARVVEVGGRTVSEMIRNLESAYPGMAKLLTQNDALRPGIMVAVDDTVGTRSLLQPLSPDSEVRFIPALFGG